MRDLIEKLESPPVLKAGLWGLAFLILADTYHDLWEIFHFDWYRVMQADMPDWLVCVRFVVSASLRIGMLWAVAGVVALSDRHRKLLLGLALFNAMTFFLHHRYPSFIYISEYLGENAEDFVRTVSVFGHQIYWGAVVRMFDAWLGEFSLAILTIAFFINPKVKQLFR
jgi:hypothetical protein